jgi:hypothetical protein
MEGRAMKLKVHPIAWMIRPEGASMFDERAIEIRIDDEAAGPFVVVKSQLDEVKPGEVSIDPGEWPTIRAAIDAAMKVANEIEKDQEGAKP